MLSSPLVRVALSLIALPVVWLACSSGGGVGTGATSTGTASSSSTASSSGGGTTTSSTGGHGGATTGTGGSGGHGGAGGASSSSSGTGGSLTGTRVRLVASNLSSGTKQSYDPGEGVRILQGIKGDIVLMQEMNYGDGSTTAIRALVDAACGTTCDFTRGTGQLPNGVLSRYPILDSGTWADALVTNRDFTWARIDVPGTADLWAVSVHLLTSNPTDRNTEATAIVNQLAAAVPAGSFVVVGGDFNTDVRTEPALTAFAARLSTAAPYPVDNNGNGNTSAPRTRPYDWLLVSPELRAREAAVVIGAAHFDTGLVVDTRVYTPLADLAPALAGDSGATGMQHMAVVRDFLLE
jgi:endonuclease/exonuclease/phosphatase family metal-dependent hydrolase